MNRKQLLIILSSGLLLSMSALAEQGDQAGADAADLSFEPGYVVLDDAVYTEEQLQQADAAHEKLIAAYAGWAECLKGVHDKETADAAAELYMKWDELRYGVVQDSFAGGWITPLCVAVHNDTRVGELHKAIMQEIKRLKAVDPPFYGNETLQRTQWGDVCP